MKRLCCSSSIVVHFLVGLLFGISIGLVFLSNDPKTSKSLRYDGYEQIVRDLFHFRFNTDEYSALNDEQAANIKLSKPKKRNDIILCWLYIMDPNHFTNNTRYVNITWGRKCNKIIFFVEKYNSSFPAVGFDVEITNGLTFSSSTMVQGFRYIFQTYLNDADWFIGMIGCPYIVMENLRHFLSKLDTDDPTYYGHQFWSSVAGGTKFANPYSGIVLSKGGLQRLGIAGDSVMDCNEFQYVNGEQFARCMDGIGVSLRDSRDKYGKSRFVVRSLNSQFEVKKFTFLCDTPDWKDLEPLSCSQPENSVSDEVITFSGPHARYYPGFDYFIYLLKPAVFSRNTN